MEKLPAKLLDYFLRSNKSNINHEVHDRTTDVAREQDSGRPQGDQNSRGLNPAPGERTRCAVLSLVRYVVCKLRTRDGAKRLKGASLLGVCVRVHSCERTEIPVGLQVHPCERTGRPAGQRHSFLQHILKRVRLQNSLEVGTAQRHFLCK